MTIGVQTFILKLDADVHRHDAQMFAPVMFAFIADIHAQCATMVMDCRNKPDNDA
jgi:hypothetical protein